jgi:hypothetical protein
MATTEHAINNAIAGVLRATTRKWTSRHIVRSDNAGMLKSGAQRPDILIGKTSSVVIENEVMAGVRRPGADR